MKTFRSVLMCSVLAMAAIVPSAFIYPAAAQQGPALTTAPAESQTPDESEREAVAAVIRELYRTHLGREADAGGIATFAGFMLEEGRDADWVAKQLRRSGEGQAYRQRRKAEAAEKRTAALRDGLGRLTDPARDLQAGIASHSHLILSLLLSITFGFIISQVYKQTHRGMNYELSFMSTLVLLAPIVTLVMLYIRGDLVLSLGLIGSLSIIRFRTPIKDSRDMIFLFWTIAIGLGAGTYNWSVVIVSGLIMVPLVFLLYFIRYGRSRQADFVLICSGNGPCAMEQMRDAIGSMVKDAVVRSHEVSGDAWESVFELRRSDSGETLVNRLVPALQQIPSVDKVSLLSPKLDLPV